MTLEDPVEHRMPGVCQTSIDANRQWDYAQGLRAVLRQDPDVLLVGEVRDSESCSMTIRAVSTGHKILTSVHAGCAHTALHRLRVLSAQDSDLGLGLRAIIAQRLLRLLCEHCQANDVSCHACLGTGYRGRQVVMEVLEVNEKIKTLLLNHAGIDTIRRAAEEDGFISMRQRTLELIELGRTTHQELYRVLGRDNS